MYGNMNVGAFEHITLCSRRDFNNSKRLAAVESCARFWVVVGADCHSHSARFIRVCTIRRLNSLIVIDYCNWDLA